MNPHGVTHQILSLARLPDSATLAKQHRANPGLGSALLPSLRRVARRHEFGEPCRDRTYDPLIKSQLLYQLS